MQYFCGLKWAITEFGDDTCIETLRPVCQDLLRANGSGEGAWLLYVLVLVGAFAFFRIVALVWRRWSTMPDIITDDS